MPEPDRPPVFPNPFESLCPSVSLAFVSFVRAGVLIIDIFGDMILNQTVTSARPHGFLLDVPQGIYVAYVVEGDKLLGVERQVRAD